MKNKWISLVRYAFNSQWLYHLYILYRNKKAPFHCRKGSFHIRDVVVCGMQRSGSTLLYNIVNEVLRENRKVIDTFFNDETTYKKILREEVSVLVKKNHTYLPYLAKRIRQGKTIGFFTHRDIRDVAVSMMQLGWIDSIDEWIQDYKAKCIENNAILYASTTNMHTFSYKQLIEDRVTVIREVTKILGVTLDASSIERILISTSLDNMKGKSESVPSHSRYRFNNQILEKHIVDGKIDKWQSSLSPEESFRLTRHCRKYLEFFGYLQ